MTLKEEFELFLNAFSEDKVYYESLKGSKKLKNLLSAQILMDRLPLALEKAANLNGNYKFKGSVGKGQVAEIPHLCIFDEEITNSAQQGYYIAYLFSSDLSRVYISLNQGWTQYKEALGTKNGLIAIEKNAKLAQRLLNPIDHFSFSPIDLNTKNELALGYIGGNICSIEYRKESFPADSELIADLTNMVSLYQQLKGLIENSILDIGYRENELIFQAEVQTRRPKKIKHGPIVRKDTKSTILSSFWPRDPGLSAQALRNANYLCEKDRNHYTFLSSRSGHHFTEAHHLIPMARQHEFDYSLDVPENIISLCPNCHRAFHNAKNGVRATMIRKFYSERKDLLLRDRKIFIELDRLIECYNSIIED